MYFVIKSCVICLIRSTFFVVVLFLTLSISNDLFITVTSSQNYFQTLNNVFTRNKYKNYMIGGLKALQYNHLFSDVLEWSVFTLYIAS